MTFGLNYLKSRLRCGAKFDIDDCPWLGYQNHGANVILEDGLVFFLSDRGDLCSIPVDLASWYNWNLPISADLSDLVVDYDDPFPVSVYYKGGYKNA